MTTAVYFDQYNSRNHISLAQLINGIFEYRSRLLFIRIDFGYMNEYRNSITLEMAQKHRERFLDNKRRNHTLFDHLLGYAWSFEHGSFNSYENSGSAFHHHFLLIYDGAYRQEDISLGIGIANYWRNVITNGMGLCYVSNFDKDKLARDACLGIGMIHRDELDLRNNLLQYVAGYIAKDSQIQDFRSARSETGEFRTFGRSRLLPPLPDNVLRRGRPPIQKT